MASKDGGIAGDHTGSPLRALWALLALWGGQPRWGIIGVVFGCGNRLVVIGISLQRYHQSGREGTMARTGDLFAQGAPMPYDSFKHHRRSVRRPGYDYRQAGTYFVTICLHERRPLFGEIRRATMCYNDIGTMIVDWWLALPTRFPLVALDAWILMPDHFHGILVFSESMHTAGAPPILGAVVGWFKTMSTNAYLRGVKEQDWPPINMRLWQRSYWERIIRSEKELINVRSYIAANQQRCLQ